MFGAISRAIDLTQHPTPFGPIQVLPGQAWNFTTWYRASLGHATSNFSNGLQVVFTN